VTIKANGVPFDDAAERALLAGCSIWKANVPRLLGTVTMGDFYTPRHQRLFLAIKNLHERGEATEVLDICNELEHLGDDEPSWFGTALANEGSADITGPLRLVCELSLRRRLLAEAGQLAQAARDVTTDPGVILDTAIASFNGIQTPLLSQEPDDIDIEEFIAQGLVSPNPWLIEGLLRKGWRTVVVAREGKGKTWLLRQIAVAAGYGIHPLRQDSMPQDPVRTLLIDLENPEDHIQHSLDMLVRQAKADGGKRSEYTALWRRPGGINLRLRADRAEVENILIRRRPELVVIGPLYKSYRVKSGDSWDLVAGEVQSVFDDWRARFDITLLIEDHAPKGTDLVPFGSSMWLRWPEVGLALQEEKDMSLSVNRWRGDRMTTDWPLSLVRSSPWPWEGRWHKAAPLRGYAEASVY
jgi:replicative DNA helicase